MSSIKSNPPLVEPGKKVCPVCRKVSYSRGGVHPQCAAELADAPRKKKLAEEKKKSATNKKTASWKSKQCPKCRQYLHVRRKTCECGYVLIQ